MINTEQLPVLAIRPDAVYRRIRFIGPPPGTVDNC